MKAYDALIEKPVLILGLAKSGYESAKLCHKLGADVTVNDGKDLSSDPHALELEQQGIRVISGEHPLSLLDNKPLIVKKPWYTLQHSTIARSDESRIGYHYRS